MRFLGSTLYMTVRYAGWKIRCIPVSHLYRVTNTKCRIRTVFSPVDGHIIARNMWRKAINILRKLCIKLVLFTRSYTRMHGHKRTLFQRRSYHLNKQNTFCGDLRLKKIPAQITPYPTAFPYGNGMVLHFYQQQESSTTKTVHKVINKGLKTYV